MMLCNSHATLALSLIWLSIHPEVFKVLTFSGLSITGQLSGFLPVEYIISQ